MTAASREAIRVAARNLAFQALEILLRVLERWVHADRLLDLGDRIGLLALFLEHLSKAPVRGGVARLAGLRLDRQVLAQITLGAREIAAGRRHQDASRLIERREVVGHGAF